MDNNEIITKLEQFKQQLNNYQKNKFDDYSEIRTQINRDKGFVQQVLMKTETLKSIGLYPSPLTGGPVIQNANPFDLIFNNPYPQLDVISVITDCIDEAIGVIVYDGNFTLNDEVKSSEQIMIDQTNTKLQKSSNKKIFVVHGHNEEMKLSVSSFLDLLDLDPIILNEQASKSMTIIEKLEANSDVDFAVVLLSPCDEGRKAENDTVLKPRARQNVILELGYFIGLLGRSNVCVLKKNEVEEPSDFTGIIYVPFDDAQGWKITLAQELRAAGYCVDFNKIIKK